MCRHLAWLGEPRSLHDLVLAPPHGLLTQSYAPRWQKHGLLNADGWGVGIFADAPDVAQAANPPRPHRWRSNRPLWGDVSFASMAPLLSSGCVVAAVRSATVGMPLDETAAAPFTDGRWLLSHNGRVDRAALPLSPAAESMCDSALLAALVFAAGAENVGGVVLDVADRDPSARLNLLLADGERVVATTWGDTLFHRTWPDGVAVASEPWDDDPAWVEVPDRQLLTVTRTGGVTITPLESP